MPDQPVDKNLINQIWYDHLTTGNSPSYLGPLGFRDFRRIMKWLPRNPRCFICSVPFSGIGGVISRLAFNRIRSTHNPNMCNICENFAAAYQGGAELEISMLFADVRGSTSLAEKMAPLEFSRLIDRFYRVTTDILIESNAWIEKLIGDEVTGLFIPGFVGEQHARLALEAARSILRATGHGEPGGPWIPVGVGVHTGLAYVGAVGKEGGMSEITALGDSVNTAARLAASAAAGEILVGERSWAAAGLAGGEAEVRHLQLKGRSEPISVRVLRARP
jgi:adenylate cyclase